MGEWGMGIKKGTGTKGNEWASFVRVSLAVIKHNDQKPLGDQSMVFTS